MSARVTRSRSKERSPNVSGASSSSTPRGVGRNTSYRSGVSDNASFRSGVGDNTSYRNGETYSDDDDDSDRKEDHFPLDESEDFNDHTSVRSHSGYSEYLEAAGSFVTSPKHADTNFSRHESPSPPRTPLYPNLGDFKTENLARSGLHTRKRTSPKSIHREQATAETSRVSSPRHAMNTRRPHSASGDRPRRATGLEEFLRCCLTEYRSTCSICAGIVIFVIALYLIMPLLYAPAPPNTPSVKYEREDIVFRFEQEFKLFQAKFLKQSGVMLRTLKAASKSVMRETNPIKPGIILLAGNRKAFDTVDCIAQHMLNITTRAYGIDSFVEIKKEHLAELRTYHDMKKHLEDSLRTGFAHGKVALVHSLESIHGKAAILFHAFCDNENAPFKDTVIIFTVHVDTDDDVEDEQQVEAYLDEMWHGDLEIDSRSPLMTRIANFVAIAAPESDTTLQKHC